MYSAYDALSENDQRHYQKLTMIHSLSGLQDYLIHKSDASPEAMGSSTAHPVRWPLVHRHPATGRRSLYFASHATIGVEDWPQSRSLPFVERLTEHATRPAFCYRHHWVPGDVVMRDNRRVLHAGTYYDLHNTRVSCTEPRFAKKPRWKKR